VNTTKKTSKPRPIQFEYEIIGNVAMLEVKTLERVLKKLERYGIKVEQKHSRKNPK
jgi:hypothetical protein